MPEATIKTPVKGKKYITHTPTGCLDKVIEVFHVGGTIGERGWISAECVIRDYTMSDSYPMDVFVNTWDRWNPEPCPEINK